MLVDAGATVDARDGSGVTPFGLAARWGNRAVLDVLLNAAPDVGHRDDLGKTVLHLAAQYDHAEVCEALIAHGAEPERAGQCGQHAAP
jgi:tankyrase